MRERERMQEGWKESRVESSTLREELGQSIMSRGTGAIICTP